MPHEVSGAENVQAIGVQMAMSKFSLLGNNSPFWALLLGVATSTPLGELGAARRQEAQA